MGELLPYYALFYAFGLLLMALFVRLFWSKKKENDINRIITVSYTHLTLPTKA